MQLKFDSYIVIKNFITYVENQFSAKVGIVRSGNVGEIVNRYCSQLFSSKVIVHQTTCANTPQQNGMAERKHRHLLEVARALKIQSSVPDKFWGDCILTACHIINVLLSVVLKYQSPHERLYGTPPTISHFRVFGCLCYGKNMRSW